MRKLRKSVDIICRISFSLIILLGLTMSDLSGMDGLAVMDSNKQEFENLEEIILEFQFLENGSTIEQVFYISNRSKKVMLFQLQRGAKLQGKNFVVKGVQESFKLQPGQTVSAGMTFTSGQTHFSNWETGFIVATANDTTEVRFICFARRNIAKNMSVKEEASWNEAVEWNSQDAYKEFVRIFPNSKVAREAQSRINAISQDSILKDLSAQDPQMLSELKQAIRFNDRTKYSEFLMKYPKSNQAKVIENHLLDLKQNEAWTIAEKKGTDEAYREFLASNPEGKYSYLASKKLRIPIPAPPEEIKNDLNKLKEWILYFLPDTMIVGESYRVDMTINTPGKSNGTKAKLKLNNDLQIVAGPFAELAKKDQPVSPPQITKLRSQLLDTSPEKIFHIVPFGENEKLVNLEGADYTLWQWDVVPLKPGRHNLNFLVEVLVNSGPGTYNTFPVFTKRVEVETLPGPLTKYIPWVVVLTGIFVSFFIWMLIKRRKSQSPEGILEQASKIADSGERAEFLIKNNRIQDALETMLTFVKGMDDDVEQDLILLKSGLLDSEEKLKKGFIDMQMARQEKTRIQYLALEIIQKLRENAAKS